MPASVSNTTTHSEMNSSGRSRADIWRLSSSRAWAGSRYWRRKTRSRYLAWKAVIDGSMPWPVTSPMTAAIRVGADAEHVVEVAGHEPGAGLVHPAELEAREVGQRPRGPGGRPSAGAPAPPGRGPPRPAARAWPRSSARRASAQEPRGRSASVTADRDEQQRAGERRPSAGRRARRSAEADGRARA